MPKCPTRPSQHPTPPRPSKESSAAWGAESKHLGTCPHVSHCPPSPGPCARRVPPAAVCASLARPQTRSALPFPCAPAAPASPIPIGAALWWIDADGVWVSHGPSSQRSRARPSCAVVCWAWAGRQPRPIPPGSRSRDSPLGLSFGERDALGGPWSGCCGATRTAGATAAMCVVSAVCTRGASP